MRDFFSELTGSWWGILIIVVAALIIWQLLSILFYRVFFKRFYDIVLSGVALIVLSPIMLVICILVRINIGKPVLFKQYRPGKRGKIFAMKKFRTMSNKTDAGGNLLPDDMRMIKFGKILRSTSLDELPELWNIFIGQMSLVGPRPQLVKDIVFMDENINRRHNVRGGLTGLAQVSGRNNLTWDERFEYDLKYVEKITFFGDLKILLATVIKVFKQSDISTSGMETSEDYGDYLLRMGKISKEEFDEGILKARKMLEEMKR